MANDPWLCICGKTNTSPACPNCGRVDNSAAEDLRKGGEAVGASSRASMLGIGWATSQSSRALIKGCWIYVVIAIVIPVLYVLVDWIIRMTSGQP